MTVVSTFHAIDMLSTFIVFFCFPGVVLSNQAPSIEKLQLPPNVTGPESLAFDLKGEGPYTGVEDGRILKYEGPNVGFVDFASTSPLRTKKQCDGSSDQNLEPICGRPFGLAFSKFTGELYIVDSSFGLLVVGPNGGLATKIATKVDGIPFGFLNSVDIDPTTGVVYFTDCGNIFRTRNATIIDNSGDTSGQLLKYDPSTKQITLLLTGLSGANGVAVSEDGEFVLVTEYIANRTRRFWLKGPKTNSSDILVTFGGNPDNIKRTPSGDFWVAVIQNKQPTVCLGQRINWSGKILETVNFFPEYISEVQQHVGALYIGSGSANFVGKIPSAEMLGYLKKIRSI